ncbi:succinate dehydrogenase, hydrophobic membrane anchor protein [Sphingomonas sp. MAH-20]|uniref:Succinate dehydrogenase hydrophobic membrane anchor subunit n=1 Tax=Sphingomonas horti TaxID=2682842 RepID=A0A6I4J205_9SPHN|nr:MULTISPECIES: succinate dehydrogenase, hydrophobic membrane anchor protein [Sphingomonas]MBA2918619.1 succinate dehydrogenase, hydrophobic membrane anchor protein [Sphingomonas sp. CGMCC 1.13658]MVO78650.1 succinate dehydrogenase, hydrophobic membrane anchor protein [Sphingomonas horti]
MGTGTEIGRVRGLGSAKEGAHHWWIQRLTAGSNLLLMLWFLFSLLRLPHYDHATIMAWLSEPLAAIPMILLVLSVFWHFRLGLQVVIEDYQHGESRVVMLVLLNFYTIAMAAFAIFAILKIAFTGGAV